MYGLIVAACVGHFLLDIPVQLSDCYGNMLKLESPWRALMVNEFTQHSYLRPFLFAELKLVYDASGGNYFAWFRGTHVVQIIGLVLLYLALVRPRTWRDAALVPFGLAVLIGLHTFKGTVNEAFPINTFLTVLVFCLVAANLALMTHRWWIDVLAATLFVVAALTVESGLLVWVVFIGAALVGGRGVSKAGIGALVTLLAGYFVLRFAVLHIGSPGLIERASGYGFHTLEPEQLVERFGHNPVWFYAYNIVTSALSVVLSEPRGGVFRLVYGVTLNDPEPSAIVNVVASACATLVLVVYCWRRRHGWLARRFDRDGQLVLLFVMVLAANAMISYPYTKDVIMSPAGAFFAVAVFAAARGLTADAQQWSAWRSVAAVFLCAVLASTWALRSVGLHLNLRLAGAKMRTEWAYADTWVERQNMTVESSQEQALFSYLRKDAIYTHPAPPGLSLVDNEIFDVD